MQINKPELKEYKKSKKLMGNMFEITVVASNEIWANKKIDIAVSEIKRIETLFTTYNDNSQINLINKNAGLTAVKVDREVFELIKRSIKISSVTDGAFDITYGSVDKSLWNFNKNMKSLPDENIAKESVRLINYKNILLDEISCTVMLKEKGMRIGFGGIGKGYAAEKAKALLKQNGVDNGIVNAAGDLTAWGLQANGKPWTIGVANPNNTNLPFASLTISNMAVATSGNYEKFVIINGQKYSHTINPLTGLPVIGIKSVTIITTNAEIADAMATPVTILGIHAGLKLINQMQHIHCIIIDDNNKIFTSKNINLQ